MNVSKAEIGERLKNRRKELHLTQEQMAEKLDISIKHYSEAERGIIGFSMDNWIKTAAILGISLDYLLMGISIEYPVPVKLAELYAICPDEKKSLLIRFIELTLEWLAEKEEL